MLWSIKFKFMFRNQKESSCSVLNFAQFFFKEGIRKCSMREIHISVIPVTM